MEQEYAKLTYKPTAGDRAKKMAVEIVTEVAKAQVRELTTSVVSPYTSQVKKHISGSGSTPTPTLPSRQGPLKPPSPGGQSS
jgi:hypothetical protein